MTNYTVTATFTVSPDSPAALERVSALAGSSGGDERSQIEAALNAGLKELPGLVRRYGFTVSARPPPSTRPSGSRPRRGG